MDDVTRMALDGEVNIYRAAELKQSVLAALRQGDTLARLGGDEFTIVLPELQSRGDADIVAQKALECLQLPFELAGSVLLMLTGLYLLNGYFAFFPWLTW